MNRLSYNDEKELAKANPRDLMKFFSMLYSDSDFKNKTIFIGNFDYTDDKETPSMVTATIRFQVFSKDDLKGKGSRVGTTYEWVSYRAKSFACINSGFRLVKNNL